MSAGAGRPMVVYYLLPGDNDDSEHPNAFEVIPAGGPGVKLRDIRSRFPLPGKYHFRFKMRWESGPIWMDVTNEDSSVPLFDDRIFMKVLRFSWNDPRSLGQPAGAAGPAAAPPPAAAPQQQQQQQQQAPPAPAPAAASRPPPAAMPAAQMQDMLGFGDPSRPAAGQPASGQKDDFDMLFS
mmetsp:Transcript_56731/g.148596  ORF Transcript_56731/g.148596 Transcript_56731/m.148596 type:complete len:181 (+) Transcript_56731:74-616(+)